ncbi:MAG: type II toxin-antitoxin system RelE/ParE family toxin [Oscillospiraceae bacterium]|jgi:addiction module RelE/StbE family toxin|nr:type II toxin-antitoxin system RelE/ParE family toxin [Oscillospiraceae bacterium]
MAQIEYSPKAISDLEEIGDYIERDLSSPKAALNTINNILKSVDNLSAFPLMGASLSSIANIVTDYRFLVCGKYIVFYRSNENTVFIDRILYGKRNNLAILFPEI